MQLEIGSKLKNDVKEWKTAFGLAGIIKTGQKKIIPASYTWSFCN
jgi:hypothetical protein